MTEPDVAPATDRDLLRAFADRRDGAAFAVLVGRYGPFVYGACRRVLGDGPDAEDAFQATFLVLARKAGPAGRPEHLGGWLYAVAVRCARRARAAREARRGRERPLVEVPAPPPADPDWSDVRPVLDEEIGALPDKLRSALVACELQGLDRAAAATALGVPEGTVSSRLARAKEALRGRLARRGLALTAVGIGVLLAKAAPAAVPPGLAAAGRSAAAVGLANAEVIAMFWTKAAKVGLAAVVLAAGGVGVGVVGYRQAVAAEDKKPDKDLIQGEWVVTGARKNGQGPADKDEVVGQKLAFDGGKMKFGPFEGEWALDPSKDPRQIDITVVVGPENEKGKVSRGVYKLDGDKLTLHLSHPGGERPAGFESKEGENCILLTLERAKK